MLSHIHIKNFAIIKEIDIDLNDNLNIISGETGTGKSIVIQAINMALGGRGSASFVSEGANKALVQLVFSLDERERELIGDAVSLSDDDLIISREFNKNGKSLARVNGEIVNLSALASVTRHLMDIHGQYDNQTLMNPENHINIIDSLDQKILPAKENLAKTFGEYRGIKQELNKIINNRAEFLRKQSFMQHELNEINAADIHAGEDEELTEQLNILQNSEKIFSALSESYEILYNNPLNKSLFLMEGISQYSTSYAEIAENLAGCVYTISDICDEIRRARDEISFSPDEIDSAIKRIDMLDNLKMKYGNSLESVIAYRDKCAAELELCENIDDREDGLKEKLAVLEKQVILQSKELSELRKKSGKKLAELMTKELQELNFANAQFDVSFETNKLPSGQPALSANGTDKIEFLFNANKGGTLKPLAEIASGGEISRISLAFERITNDSEGVATMVFDEIDTGISGITASVVGRKMHQIAENHQIICITHLPQIAAAGEHQYLISKDDSDDRSYTTIKLLSEDERVSEIARLLGGDNITEITLASARELLTSFHDKK
ncbi:MAG: DNA repair protein RecN [Firmicutes bacterium]|nr:DNA repair protein RecN [Bacillota bacterium]